MHKLLAPPPFASAVICAAALAALAGAYFAARTGDRITAAHHHDESLEREFADLAAATPEAIGRLQQRMDSHRAALPTASAFEKQMHLGAQRWSAQSRSSEFAAGIEIRHYVLVYDRPTLQSWGDIVGTIEQLCALPGLSIDRFLLAASPDSDRFIDAQLAITVRLRP